jgi:hypothetical protein
VNRSNSEPTGNKSLLVRLKQPSGLPLSNIRHTEVKQRSLLVTFKLPSGSPFPEMGIAQSIEQMNARTETEMEAEKQAERQMVQQQQSNAPHGKAISSSSQYVSMAPPNKPMLGHLGPHPTPTTAVKSTEHIPSSPLLKPTDLSAELGGSTQERKHTNTCQSSSTSPTACSPTSINDVALEPAAGSIFLTEPPSSTLSHISVHRRKSPDVPRRTLRQASQSIMGLVEGAMRKKEKPGKKSKTRIAVLAELKGEEPKIQSLDEDSDDDVPLIKLVQFQKHNHLTSDEDESPPPPKRRNLRSTSPTQRRMRRIILDDEEEDMSFFVPEFEYNTRSKGVASTSNSSSPLKKSKEYNQLQDVDLTTAMFPVLVKDPSAPGTFLEFEDANDIQEELGSMFASEEAQTETHARITPLPVFSRYKPNPIIVYMDEMEEQFGNSLFFVMGAAKHAEYTRLLTVKEKHIVDIAAQAWLDTVRRGRAEFERNIRPLGLLDTNVRSKETPSKSIQDVDELVQKYPKNAQVAPFVFKTVQQVDTLVQDVSSNVQEVPKPDKDPLASIFAPFAEHLRLIPQHIDNPLLSPEEARSKVHASLVVIGDFIQNKYPDPKENEERMKLWSYFGYKSFNKPRGSLSAGQRVHSEYLAIKAKAEMAKALADSVDAGQ